VDVGVAAACELGAAQLGQSLGLPVVRRQV
jgi:hypothetical protein